jgi:hypothetical protein
MSVYHIPFFGRQNGRVFTIHTACILENRNLSKPAPPRFGQAEAMNGHKPGGSQARDPRPETRDHELYQVETAEWTVLAR